MKKKNLLTFSGDLRHGKKTKKNGRKINQTRTPLINSKEML